MKLMTISPPSLRSLLWGGRVLLIAALSVAGLLRAPCAAFGQEGKATSSSASIAPAAQPPNSLLLLQQIEEGLAVIVKQVNASVVTIEGRSVRRAGVAVSVGSIALKGEGGGQRAKTSDNEFSQYLGGLLGASATGSGFLIEGGYVVTTAEVVNRIKEPMVVLANGEHLSAELVKTDKESNIALLKLANAPEKTGLKWGDSDRVQPGYFAITLGNQGGFANSISLGLIAGKGRAGKSGEVRYNDLIQFQGIVGKGGSGSPLINARGEVIGMVVATPATQVQVQEEPKSDEARGSATINVGVSNVGFAIPSNELRRIVELLKKSSLIVKQGWLGVNLATNLGDSLKNPAKIVGIYMGGPAYRAGLRYGDTVTMVNGVKVTNTSELRMQLRKLGSGEALRIGVLRDGKPLTLSATIEPRPEDSEILRMRVISEPDPGN